MLSNISYNSEEFDKKISVFYKKKLDYELKKIKQQRDLNIEKLKIIKDQHINQVKFNKLNEKEYELENKIKQYNNLIKEKQDENNGKCMICLDDNKNNITTLICKHKFHFNCLVNLIFHSKNECPLCRSEITDLPEIHAEFSKKNRKINALECDVTFYRNEIIQLSDVIYDRNYRNVEEDRNLNVESNVLNNIQDTHEEMERALELINLELQEIFHGNEENNDYYYQELSDNEEHN